MLRRYFEDEMRALQEAGREFASHFPEQARQLHPESQTDRDPHVERLFEGFAFLVGRVRQRLDDELPEYTEGLFRLLYPHYLRPVPALTVVEFTPRPGLLQQTEVVAPGFEVRSGPTGDERTVCRFRTTSPVRLQPFKLVDVGVAWPTPSTATMTLRLEIERSAKWSALELDPLRVYFGHDPAVATPLRLALARHLTGVTVRAGAAQTLPASAVTLAGNRDEGVLPRANSTFPGFTLLQEYFSFRQRFAFAEIRGLDALDLAGADQALEIDLRFSRALPHEVPMTTSELRLFCTPAINLFEDNAEPVSAEFLQSDYAVRADAQRPRSVEVYDVKSVDSIDDRGARHSLAPYHSFSWPGGRFYEEISRAGPDGRRQISVALGGETDGPTSLSLGINCTNGDLPHDALTEGALSKTPPGVKAVAAFRNLGRPTRSLRPPLDSGQGFLWRLVAYLAVNRASIATPEALGALLSLHDWTGDPANARRVQSLRSVAWRPVEALHRGGIVRGAECVVEVEDGAWVDEGDLHLFGAVLSAVLADYATINSFVHLDLTARPSGRHFRWTPRTGTQPLL